MEESASGVPYRVKFTLPPSQGFAQLIVSVYTDWGLFYSTQSWYQAKLQGYQDPGYSILGTKATSVSGRPAFEVQRQYTLFQDIQLLLVEGPHAYQVLGVSTYDTWAIWGPILEGLVYTFGFS